MGEMVPLQSSNLAGASYDDETQELHVMFIGGGEYAYAGVPRALYDQLLVIDSPGTFLNRTIKPSYRARRIG